jgi:lysophospholipase L1-like esterase
MNSNRRVLLFVVGSVTIFLFFSVLAQVFHFQWMPFNRVNLISDIVIQDSTQGIADTNPDDSIHMIISDKPKEDFTLYHQPRIITNFSTDTTQPTLPHFLARLHELQTTKKGKIRIAYFGDSMIEGDLLTQTLRKLLQQAFGGSGVGFVPITSQVSKFRQSVVDNYSGGWQDENFKTGNNPKLFLSGHLFRSSGDWVQMLDQTITDSTAIIEKSLLCGQASSPISVTVNNTPFIVHADHSFNRIVMGKDLGRGIKLSVSNEELPVYGISFETESGIFLDNFSFRGITGIEFSKIDAAFMKAIDEKNPYDLIVFQYGVNLLFRPNDRNFNWYAKALLPVVNKFKSSFPNADFLVVSTADRAFRYGGEYRSAVGIDSLVKIQASLAYETGSSFYNQFASMGGTNSIVEWAKRTPALANKDYVHPNHRGAEVLGNYFFEALIDQYERYKRTIK